MKGTGSIKIILLRLAVTLGVGLLPGPKGTYGSALTVLACLAWLWGGGAALTGPGFLFFWALFCLLSTFLTHLALKHEVLGGSKDPQSLVIDEAAGVLLALYGVSCPAWTDVAAGFILFRFFDILKPFPVNTAEKLPGAWGVMADDIVAGAMSLLTIWLSRFLLGL